MRSIGYLAARARRAAERGLSLAGERACLLCLGASRSGPLCAACDASLPTLSRPCCPRCALPRPETGCPRCEYAPPPFDAAAAVFEYRYPVDRLIHALKYGKRLPLAAWCATQLAAAIAGEPLAGDVALVPMPASAARLSRRGFDHAVEIARPLAHALGVECLAHACVRIADRVAQASLPWSERAANVAGVFRCRARVAGRSLVIVDDVMTTGASAGELARTLIDAGAAHVEVWTVARALPPVGRR